MFFTKKPDDRLKIIVIIPVKDEECTVLSALDALRRQKDAHSKPLAPYFFEVLLLANNCSDGTANVARNFQSLYPSFQLQIAEVTLPVSKANVGNARRFLMDAAYNRFVFGLGRVEGIIASTDGDSEVDSYWLSGILREMQRGCDLIGGAILPLKTEKVRPPHLHALDISYHNLVARAESTIDPLDHNPWPSHFQCFAANLAITCELYGKVGRLPEVPYLEDIALEEAAALVDAKIRRSPDVKVFTSLRKNGRVERGLSQQLSYFDDLKVQKRSLFVESAESVLSRITLRHWLRKLWSLHRAGSTLEGQQIEQPFSFDVVQGFLRNEYFGMAWKEAQDYLVKLKWFSQWPLQEIRSAIGDLERYLATKPTAG